MPKVLEKVERRLGEKLFLKGDRCIGPKCAFTRRSYAPGAHGKKKRRRGSSEFGELLREKQKVRFVYGLDDRDLERYSKEASDKQGIFNSNFFKLLEGRLDNVLFRLGFTMGRRQARVLVNHGHATVNGRTVTVPSYRIKKGDVVSLKERSLKSPLFEGLDMRLKNYNPPAWLELDKSKKVGKVVGLPEVEEVGLNVDFTRIKEFYSR